MGHFSDLFEGQAVPKPQHDDFALLLGEVRERVHRSRLRRVGCFRRLKPVARLQFAGESAPKAALAVQHTVAEGTDKILGRLTGTVAELKQYRKNVLDGIFRLAVPKSQSPPIQDKPCSLGFEKLLGPWSSCARPDIHFKENDTATHKFVWRRQKLLGCDDGERALGCNEGPSFCRPGHSPKRCGNLIRTKSGEEDDGNPRRPRQSSRPKAPGVSIGRGGVPAAASPVSPPAFLLRPSLREIPRQLGPWLPWSAGADCRRALTEASMDRRPRHRRPAIRSGRRNEDREPTPRNWAKGLRSNRSASASVGKNTLNRLGLPCSIIRRSRGAGRALGYNRAAAGNALRWTVEVDPKRSKAVPHQS